MTEWLPVDHPDAPERAADVIRRGGLIILPTDTVYGVAADLWQPEAVANLYRVKGRPPDRAIPILLADIEDMSQVAAEVPDTAHKLAQAFWPGPLTIAVPKRAGMPEIVSALPTVGVRIPDHAGARAIIRACGGALAVTSANRSGQASPLTAQQAAQALGEGITLVLDGGPCQGGVPSTVVDVAEGDIRVLREGPVDEVALRRVLRT
jgi:L-threonylcarbamoyladenylate synthase